MDEGIDALEAAIEFKNEGIANKQKELDSGQLLTDKDREGLVNKLSNLSPGEATSLLSKYFEKVVELRGTEKKLELRCSDLEVRVEVLFSVYFAYQWRCFKLKIMISSQLIATDEKLVIVIFSTLHFLSFQQLFRISTNSNNPKTSFVTFCN